MPSADEVHPSSSLAAAYLLLRCRSPTVRSPPKMLDDLLPRGKGGSSGRFARPFSTVIPFPPDSDRKRKFSSARSEAGMRFSLASRP
eukprot:1080475-Rhodomonas_salina.1